MAIRNFKTHFLSVFACVADDSPFTLWDHILPQTEITLNLLRQSNATPTVSVYAHLSGLFNYNKMPLAPMGCAVQIHEKTDNRGTWQYHSVNGWYHFTSEEHYHTHNCHVKATRIKRLTNTINLQHKHITNPKISHANKVMAAISECAKVIRGMNATEKRSQHEALTATCSPHSAGGAQQSSTFCNECGGQPTTSSEGVCQQW